MTIEQANSQLTQMLYRMVQEPRDAPPEEGTEAL